MPYPTQISRDAVIEKARELIEAEGLEQVSLNRLATALNVKAPSLYRYFDGKNELLRAVNDKTQRALSEALEASIRDAATPKEGLMAMAQAYRAFGHRYPVTYGLLYANHNPEQRSDADENLRFTLANQRAVAEVVGEADSMAALCGAWALIHGFIMLELNDLFRLGGDLDATFIRVIEAYIAGWQ
jgi:AcrR family transcriptional regulator